MSSPATINWLSVRQTAIAGNIANANTPGYKALDVEPFEKVLETTRLAMRRRSPGTCRRRPPDGRPPTRSAQRENPGRSPIPATSVSLEQELIKAGEVNRAFRLNTSVAKAFHRMLLASAKV